MHREGVLYNEDVTGEGQVMRSVMRERGKEERGKGFFLYCYFMDDAARDPLAALMIMGITSSGRLSQRGLALSTC